MRRAAKRGRVIERDIWRKRGDLRYVGGEDVFEVSEGVVYTFPKEHGKIVYCNIEGVHFINDTSLVTVSDAAKRHGKQHKRCRARAQAINIFDLPPRPASAA